MQAAETMMQYMPDVSTLLYDITFWSTVSTFVNVERNINLQSHCILKKNL